MTRKQVIQIGIVLVTIIIWTFVIIQIVHISNGTRTISTTQPIKDITLSRIDRKTLADPFSGSSAAQSRSGNQVQTSGEIPPPSVILKGILSDEANSKAIIAELSGQSKMMMPGDSIGKATLIKIESDHVIIKENNRTYKLYAGRWEIGNQP